jgi:hypothetical protein
MLYLETSGNYCPVTRRILEKARSTFYAKQAISEKIVLHAGNMKFNIGMKNGQLYV